ncbi:MAG: magnesium-translocating P-type ATPase [Promethearchaeati archaeon SRVP18_Atabeyarchaeia-1]
MASAEEFLGLTGEKVLGRLDTSISGLTHDEVSRRIEKFGYNELARRKRRTGAVKFALRFRSPLLVILIFASFLSIYLGDLIDATIILGIVFASAALDTYQESKAVKAADSLKEKVTTTATVVRSGVKEEVKLSEIVPGDVVHLSAGDIVPADARILNEKDLFVDQSALTGESFPVEKIDKPIKAKSRMITDWNNFLFMGTSVTGGTAVAVAVNTGGETEYGRIAKTLVAREPETEFERGLRRFGYLMMEVTFLLVIFVFFMNALLKGRILDSFLFSVALAVGLTPELLPMIVSINLSKGALSMSHRGVIVKRLASIQNLGSMDVLCTDKTGTLTENEISLVLHVNTDGEDDYRVLTYSYLNSYFESWVKNPLDDALLKHAKEVDVTAYRKIDEVPFDFTRRRVSVVVEKAEDQLLITKGAPEDVLKICTKVEVKGKILDLTPELHQKIEKQYSRLSAQGFRVLGVSYKNMKEEKTCSVGDERDMTLMGMIGFLDPPKHTAKKALRQLAKAGVEVKILTGDNELVTRKVCEELGFKIKGVVTGSEIYELNDDALGRVADRVNIFARVTPAQKDRIMNALKSHGHVVGFLGDGINDAPSLKTADVSISVNNAVDVAKESADIILLNKSLMVLHEGVLEGRKTFGNTMKYIRMGTSSNFGNMFSVAGGSIFLPFLPMTATQILLNNLLYDVSETTIPTDNVDKEYLESPKRLDVAGVRKFMIFLGPISSIFDFLTFFIMLFVFNASQNEFLFQTAWFVESISTQTLVIFVIRTRKTPFYRSRPSKALAASSIGIVTFAILLPFTGVGDELFHFVVLPKAFFVFLAIMIVSYLAIVELVKRLFYKRYAYRMEQTSVSKPFHSARA